MRRLSALNELSHAVREGYECYIAFVIAMPHVSVVMPNNVTHPAFGEALKAAADSGVKVLHLPCRVAPDSLMIL